MAVADLLNRIRQPFNVSRVGLAAAAAALADQDFIKKTRQTNDEQMRWLEKQFDALGLGFVKSHANFIMVEIEVEMEDTTATVIYEALLAQGVIVRPLAVYGLHNWLRITVGLAEDNLRLIDTLQSILTED